MHFIGLISKGYGQLVEPYINSLEGNRYSTFVIDRNTETSNLKQASVILIEEGPEVSMATICEWIIETRKVTDALLWVCAESCSKTNRLVYLQLGADRIFEKTTESDEFNLIMHNTLRRRESGHGLSEAITKDVDTDGEPIKLLSKNLSVIVEGKREVSLTKLEYITLEALINNIGEALTYEELHQKVWNDGLENQKQRISNIVFHIRKKIEKDTANPKYIKTVHSKGYMIKY